MTRYIRWFPFLIGLSCLTIGFSVSYARGGAKTAGLAGATRPSGLKATFAPGRRQPAQSTDARKSEPESDLRPTATTRVEPEYPPLAKAARVTGTVVVEVLVDENGNVESATALSGHPLLREAAIAAARQWKWAPAKKEGVPVKVRGALTFNFKFDPDDPSVKAAIEKAKQAAQQNPASAEAQYELGQAYLRAGRSDDAIASLNEAIKLKPDYRLAYLALGDALSRTGRSDESIETYRRGLVVAPDDKALLLRLVQALEFRGRWYEAIETQKRLVQVDPKNAYMSLQLGLLYYRAHRLNDAVAAYSQAVAAQPDLALGYQDLGSAYFALGRWEDAVNAYKKALEIKPPYVQSNRVYVDLSSAYIVWGHYDDAEKVLHQGIAAFPEYEPLYVSLGNLYFREERWREALEVYKTAMEKNPKDPNPVANTASVDRRLGHLVEAEKLFQQAIQMSPRFGRLYVELAQLYRLENKPDLEEKELKEGEKNAPADFFVHMALGSFFAGQNKLESAKTEYRTALSLSPRNEVALNDLGYYMAETGENLPQALNYIQQAVNARPEYPNYLDSLGWVYFKMGKLDLAEQNMLKAVRTGGRDSTIQEHLGDVYQAEGKKAEAIEQWRKAISVTDDAARQSRLKAKIAAASEPTPDKKN